MPRMTSNRAPLGGLVRRGDQAPIEPALRHPWKVPGAAVVFRVFVRRYVQCVLCEDEGLCFHFSGLDVWDEELGRFMDGNEVVVSFVFLYKS